MGLSIDQLLAEADEELQGMGKSASKDETPVSDAGQPYSSDEPVKLAHFLEDFAEQEPQSSPAQKTAPQEKVAEVKESSDEVEDTVFAKIAHAVAVLETVANIDQLQKTAAFVKKARESGHSEEQIGEFLEKQALKMPQISKGTLAKALGTLGLAGGAGVAGKEYGEQEGRKAGRQKGYVQGVRDYDLALRKQLQQAYGGR